MSMALEPAVIADARRRQRKRQVVCTIVAFSAIFALGGYWLSTAGGGNRPALASEPDGPLTAYDLSSAVLTETPTPYTGTPAIFARPRRSSDTIPGSVRRQLHGLLVAPDARRVQKGSLRLDRSRSIATSTATIYFVPTTEHGVCYLGLGRNGSTSGCFDGLGPEGVSAAYFYAPSAHAVVFGLASPGVAGVELVSGNGHARRAFLTGQVFVVDWPVRFHGTGVLPPADLVIRWRDGRRPAVVPIR
jgi:hypothetical protein